MTYRASSMYAFWRGQVDKYGNLNTTVIGDYYKPEMRLPGSGGAADFISYAKRTGPDNAGGISWRSWITSPRPGILTGKQP